MKATINFRGFTFDVQYDYEPAEPMVYNYGDGSGYPGFPESFNFWEVLLNGTDALDLLSDCFDDFEEEAIEQIKEQISKW